MHRDKIPALARIICPKLPPGSFSNLLILWQQTSLLAAPFVCEATPPAFWSRLAKIRRNHENCAAIRTELREAAERPDEIAEAINRNLTATIVTDSGSGRKYVRQAHTHLANGRHEEAIASLLLAVRAILFEMARRIAEDDDRISYKTVDLPAEDVLPAVDAGSLDETVREAAVASLAAVTRGVLPKLTNADSLRCLAREWRERESRLRGRHLATIMRLIRWLYSPI